MNSSPLYKTAYKYAGAALSSLILMAASAAPDARAAEPIVIEPLFEYPTAPESVEGLQERSDYLMAHFWDAMDFKSKNSVDQNALNDAFGVYAAAMRFADPQAVDASVTRLLKSVSKNEVLLLQMTKAAEESLYGLRAEYWNDPVFLRFLDAVTSAKSVKKERKLRYQRLAEQLRNTLQGATPPEFDYTTPDGKLSHFHPNGVVTVILFGDPGCVDCMIAKTRLSTDSRFASLVDQGKVNVLYVYADPEEGWQDKLRGYPANWYVGASDTVADLYDLRLTPSLYVIDRLGHVAAKNVPADTAIQIAASSLQ